LEWGVRRIISRKVSNPGYYGKRERQAGYRRPRSGGLGDDGTDETGLGGTQPLDPHIKDRPVFVLVFRTVPLRDATGPLVESILPFHLKDYGGAQRNLLREIRMFHNVTIKLVPENGIQSFKFRHGQSPRRNR